MFHFSDRDMNMTPRNPAYLSYLFQLVFGLYMLVTTVVLINLLIAMMSDTYQRIQVIIIREQQTVRNDNFAATIRRGVEVWPGQVDQVDAQDRHVALPHQPGDHLAGLPRQGLQERSGE